MKSSVVARVATVPALGRAVTADSGAVTGAAVRVPHLEFLIK